MKMKNLLCFGLLLWAPTSSYSADFYVSPHGGDSNRGTKESPFASLAAARDAARPVAGTEAVTVHVADGVYYLPETLMFTAADSGSAGHPVLYRAENEGKAVLSGGSRLDLNWTLSRDGVFQARTPAGLAIDQLFIDGKNQRMARYPNHDPAKKAEPYQGFAEDAFSKTRAAGWADPTGGYIHAMHRASWGGYHYRITGKNADGEVTYEGGWQNNRQMGMHKAYRMVENVFEELDAVGEWFHDANSSTLYYKPAAGIDLKKATVEVVRLRHLIEFKGSEKSPVSFVSLQGFAVRHAARTFMDCKEPLLRSDWAIYRGGAFLLNGTEDVSILDCEFDQVGGNAIFVNNYNRRTLIKGCHIHDTGASGVCFVGDPAAVRNPLFEYGQKNDLAAIDRTPGPKTENYPANGIVEDCLIHGIGRVERQPAGVMMDMASEITIRDCSIYDCARSGINIGDGAWGGHLIERCDVFDTVLETHDHGSFNSWGRDRYWRSDHLTASQAAVDAEPSLPFLDAVKTTVIRDSRWRCDHGWDIDLDDGSSNYDIYNNLLLNTGLKLREGFRRHAWNNVAPFGRLHPHVWFRRSRDQVTGNIFAGSHATARMSTPYVDGTTVDRNFFASEEQSILNRSAKLGWDQNSVLGNPMFIDPAKGDFRVKEGSPALKLGFKNFSMDQFGVKKPSLKAIAKTPELGHEPRQTKRGGGGVARARAAKPRWLGAVLRDLKGDDFSAFGVSQEEGGVPLTEVPRNSAAGKVGLRVNDLIQSVNAKKVANINQLFRTLSGLSTASVTLKVVRNQKAMDLALELPVIAIIETASASNGFVKLSIPAASKGKVSANQKTNNDPLSSLTDGRLGKGFGPVFSNGIHNGAYKLDLGTVQPVNAVTSWSFDMSRTRGAQQLTIYGSNSTTDPGWDFKAFTQLGVIDTVGIGKAAFTAASLRTPSGKPLGNFRWIVWAVSPVTATAGGENTAFQELAVEVLSKTGVKSAQVDSPGSPVVKEGEPTQVTGFPGKKTDFHGFDRYEFRTKTGVNVKVVVPKQAAPGKPWLWRSLFWEAIPLFWRADLKLVKEGYHVVLVHGDVSGHPSGNANIDAAYKLLTSEYGFSKKCSMASMSRGTLSLFRWASANPEKVESIYVDNGVCNLFSWPAGKLVAGNNSKAPGAPQSWAYFKKKFGYATDQAALASRESPIDQLEPLARAGVPILMVCGSRDTAVPYEENDAIMEERYKKLGGSIKVIVEDKGHSHGMEDPTPVLEFIRKHTRDTTGVGKTWRIDTQAEWIESLLKKSGMKISEGLASPAENTALLSSVIKRFDQKRSLQSMTIDQSPVWHNWKPIPNIGPSNLGDAPVMLSIGPGNYWMFGRYGSSQKKKGFKPDAAKLEGYEIPLKTTPFPNQFDAPGGLKKRLGGYHAWQSKDMVNWVHHGAVTEAFSSWVTTAEYVDGKLYIYYDYPNDQDPHLYIDEDLTDGTPGRNMGMAFKDPSHGSDCSFIRDLQGNFHVIYENWSPIDASKHSWDSPLAGHAVSSDGIGNFKILPPAVDERTKPTGRFAEYPHPHWHATDPKKYPGKPAPIDIPQHRIKAGDIRAFAKYEIHEPVQNAYGDWAAIGIGSQYYLFSDYHPANGGIRVGWFTSSSLDKPFTFCGEIGRGHPDPDIMFAEGRFYLATQMKTDYVSPGPWVESVEVRVGVDTNKDGAIDHWSDWQTVKETYDYTPGFSKQIAKTPAKLDLSGLPAGYGFQFEIKVTDTTDNASKPVLDKITLTF